MRPARRTCLRVHGGPARECVICGYSDRKLHSVRRCDQTVLHYGLASIARIQDTIKACGTSLPNDPDVSLMTTPTWIDGQLLSVILSQDTSLKNPNVSDADFAARIRNCWRCLGHFDYIRFLECSELNDALHVLDSMRLPAYSRSSTLFAVAGNAVPEATRRLLLEPDTPVSEFRAAESEAIIPKAPLLVMVDFIFTPAVYSLLKPPKLHLLWERFTERARAAMAESGLEGYAFGALNAHDVTLLIFPSDPRQLKIAYEICQNLSSLSINETLAESSSEIGDDALLCLSMIPTLCYRAPAREYFARDSYKGSEKGTGFELHVRLRVDCGRESELEDILRKELGENIPIIISWDSHSISFNLNNLCDFTTLWNRIYEKRPICQRMILGSLTTVSHDIQDFPNSRIPFTWSILDSHRATFRAIDRRVRDYAAAMMNGTERTELRTLVRGYLNSFYRPELIVNAADLLPFFDQLSRALLTFCRTIGEFDDFDDEDADDLDRTLRQSRHEVLHAIPFVTRSVRNRFDHRLPMEHPSTPSSLREVGSKVISAHTAACSIAADMLLRSSEENQPTLAAAVQIGSSGKVEFRELLRGLRDFTEHILATVDDNGDREPRLLSSIKGPDSWTTRLIQLEISGLLLMKPEQTIAHCLHEIAELSEWAESNNCEALREAINKWLVKHAIELVFSSLRNIPDEILTTVCPVNLKARPGRDLAKARKCRFAQDFVLFALYIHEKMHIPSEWREFKNGPRRLNGQKMPAYINAGHISAYIGALFSSGRHSGDIADTIRTVYRHYQPTSLASALISIGQYASRFMECYCCCLVPSEARTESFAELRNEVAQHVASGSLQREMLGIGNLLIEAIADTGMLLGIENLLGRLDDEDIAYAYAGILDVSIDCTPNQARDRDLRWRAILTRYVLQLLVFGRAIDAAPRLLTLFCSKHLSFADSFTEISQIDWLPGLAGAIRAGVAHIRANGSLPDGDRYPTIKELYRETWDTAKETMASPRGSTERKRLSIRRTALMFEMWAVSTHSSGPLLAPDRQRETPLPADGAEFLDGVGEAGLEEGASDSGE